VQYISTDTGFLQFVIMDLGMCSVFKGGYGDVQNLCGYRNV